MLLSNAICARARKTRDPRFDGRFFIGVLTTKIYCRPVCPVRSPKEENVRYYPSAAAAAEAGLRPCLRCRPECSPGTPGWLGTSATVSRALRLIGESTLEDSGMDALSERLGIGSRHLRRLFLKHLGASPIAVAQTRRLHFAKKLIDETQLPMRDIALVAGFGSVRRFNATFQDTYKRTPSHLRKLARRADPPKNDEYRFQLRFRPPFAWDALLAFLAPRATPGVEVVVGGHYRRTISLHGNAGWIVASLNATGDAINLRINFPEPRWLFLIVERVRQMFDLGADPQEISSRLCLSPMLREHIVAHPGLRVPGSWDGFELAIRAVLGQQVTVKGATTLALRLVREFGIPLPYSDGLSHLFPSPEKLANSDLQRIGVPRARANCLRAIAEAVRDKRLKFSGVADTENFMSSFCEINGIGDWTANYVAMRALGEPDAFPASDLGLLHAAGIRRRRELEDLSQSWRPWRAYAAMYLWQAAAAKPRTTPTRPSDPTRTMMRASAIA
jgi:AraC family transcriptional regulator, regulatory protein of adaptative response / DNA-3-methyladenine glycosylase II